MPNVNPETGYPHGVLDNRRAPELADELWLKAENVRHAEFLTEVRADWTMWLGELELSRLSPEEVKDEFWKIFDKRVGYSGHRSKALTDRVMALVDMPSRTFDVAEVVDEIIDQLSDWGYFDDVNMDCHVTVEHEGRSYWVGPSDFQVGASEFVTPCRACNICRIHAGDLNAACDDHEANTMAHCPAPEDWEGWTVIYRLEADRTLTEVARKAPGPEAPTLPTVGSLEIGDAELKSMRERGGRWFVYRNHDLGHPHVGHRRFLKCGEGCTYPEAPGSLDFRYLLEGELDLETAELKAKP